MVETHTRDDDLSDAPLAGRYRVRRTLGHGAVGTVYLCRCFWNDAMVAVKVLHPELVTVPGMKERFSQLAATLAQFHHPNIVSSFEWGADDEHGRLYLAMEYIEGRDLTRVIAEDWPLPAARVVDIMSQVLNALSAAHARGIAHRKLTPSNVLLRARRSDESEPGADRVMVCDFGLAQLTSFAVASRCRDEQPQTDAPAEHFDEQSDVDAAGRLLFQLLTRTAPGGADGPLDLGALSASGSVDAALQAVCLKALSETRYQTAAELRTALEAAVERPTQARAANVPRLAQPQARELDAAQPRELSSHTPYGSRPQPTITSRWVPRSQARMSSLSPAERFVPSGRDAQSQRLPGVWLICGIALGVAISFGVARVSDSTHEVASYVERTTAAWQRPSNAGQSRQLHPESAAAEPSHVAGEANAIPS
jgi:serine/threonine protein kinase